MVGMSQLGFPMVAKEVCGVLAGSGRWVGEREKAARGSFPAAC